MGSRWFDTSDLSPGLIAFLALLAVFFGAFLVYPLIYVFLNAFFPDGEFSMTFFSLMLQNPVQQRALINSFELGIAATIATTIISLPIALVTCSSVTLTICHFRCER